MANTLKFKRGLVSTIPTAALGEPLFTTDTFDLYIGNGTTNTRFQKYIASGTTSQLLRGDGSLLTMPIVLTSPTNGQVLKFNGTNWVNSADAGVTGSGTAGQVTYWNSASTITGSNNLFWDATNSRLGIGTNVPTWSLDIATTGTTISRIRGGGSANQGAAYFVTQGGSNTTLLAIGDGSTMVGGAINNAMIYVNGSPLSFNMGGTTHMALTSAGRLLLGNPSTDNGLRLQVTGDGYFSGSVGIGTTALTGGNLRIGKTLTGSVSSRSLLNESQIQSDVLTAAFYYSAVASTQAASFTLPNLYHYAASQGTFGAGSSVTNQYGYFVSSGLIGATNNYGFYGDIASGTGRWNLYMNGTAANFLAGNLRVGTTTGLYEVTGRGVLNVNGASAAVVSLSAGGSTSTAAYLYYTPSNNFEIKNAHASGNLILGAAGGEHVILNASGNLGLGVTPSAWWSSAKAIQVGTIGSLWSGSGLTNVSHNYYFNGSQSFYLTSAHASAYQQTSGQHIWYTAPSGTAGNAITFTQAMTLDASGNLGLGVTPSAWGSFRAIDIGTTGNISSFNTGVDVQLNANLYYSGSSWIYKTTGTVSRFRLNGNQFEWYQGASGTAGANASFTQAMTLFATGNLAVGTTTDAGFKLDVNGTMRVSGKMSLGNSIGLDKLVIYDGTAPNEYGIGISSGQMNFYTSSTGSFTFNQRNGSTLTESVRINDSGNVGIGVAPSFKLDVNGTFRAVGAATFSSSVTAGSFIPTSSTIPTNGMYLSAANTLAFATASGNKLTISSTGLATFSDSARFSNQKGCIFVQTGGSLLGSISMDSGNAITIDNNGFFGLSVGTNYTMTGGNLGIGHNSFGTSATKTISVNNGTAPSSSPVDSFQMYSNDVVAGNAAPHFRTENGAVIKLYQETTAVGNAIISLGGGNAVLDDTEFDGYTLRQIVRALRNQGILA